MPVFDQRDAQREFERLTWENDHLRRDNDALYVRLSQMQDVLKRSLELLQQTLTARVEIPK